MKLTTNSPFGYVYGNPGDPQPEDIKVFYLPAVNSRFPFLIRRRWDSESIYISEFHDGEGRSERNWLPVYNRELELKFDPHHPKGHLFVKEGHLIVPARIVHISTRMGANYPIFAVVNDVVVPFDSRGYFISVRSPTLGRLVNAP